MKRIRIVAFLFLLTIIAVLPVALLVSRPAVREITLIDGTPIELLGATFGTNHWNPATPKINRWIARWPAIATVVIPRLPRTVRTTPHMAVVGTQWGSIPVLWFYSRDASCEHRRIIVRGFDISGQEIGSGYELHLRSITNAAPVMMQGIGREDYRRIQVIEIYERSTPFPVGPFADLGHLGETFLGRIDLAENRLE